MEPQNALQLALQVSHLNRLKIKGLMTIGLFSAEEQKSAKMFSTAKENPTAVTSKPNQCRRTLYGNERRR